MARRRRGVKLIYTNQNVRQFGQRDDIVRAKTCVTVGTCDDRPNLVSA
jgi:hypothetical protein